jgi:hypothetical protein
LEKLFNRAKETNTDIIYLQIKLFEDSLSNNYFNLLAGDFDLQQVLSGKEAVMLTIPTWKIGSNGLIKRSLYEHLSTFKSNINHMNVDEYDARELLLLSNAVAFVNASYYYRQHPDAITKKFTIKRFDTLITYKMLVELIRKYFGDNTPQLRVIQDQRMDDIINKQTLFFRYRKLLSDEDNRKIRKMIKESYIDININKEQLYRKKRIKYLLFATNYNLFIVSTFLVMRLKNR